ncbi:MAG TPA: AraC family transcriptional regulator [Chitinophaga sp.]|nr:AraC family transcriptional regulator [Chitinophaga sp.]
MGVIIGDNNSEWQLVSELSVHQMLTSAAPLVTERREKFSWGFGDMEMVQLFFQNVFIIYGDMHLRQHHFRMLNYDMPDTVELHFSLQGGGTVYNRITGDTFNFRPNEHNITYVTDLEGEATYDCNIPHKFFEVHFTVSYFSELMKQSNPAMECFLEKINKGIDSNIATENRIATLPMLQCIRDIMNCNYKGGLKLLYLQAKCMELLSLQADAFAQTEVQSVLKSAGDKERIIHARDYLLSNLSTPPTIDELSVISGTNSFKLKRGFKELFNTTVFGYLNNARLDNAREQLLSGIPIKNVADELGFSSVQHFSSAFRKKFGCTPGMLKKHP